MIGKKEDLIRKFIAEEYETLDQAQAVTGDYSK
jgi:hypothetical protein